MTRTLLCPHCGGEFEYDLVPGMSVTAVRLGGSRYMRCPLCHRFATFRLEDRSAHVAPDTSGRPPRASASSAGPGEGSTRSLLPRFNDRSTLVRWIGVLVAPALVLALVAAFVPLSTGAAAGVLVASGAFLAVATILMIGFLLPDRVR